MGLHRELSWVYLGHPKVFDLPRGLGRDRSLRCLNHRGVIPGIFIYPDFVGGNLDPLYGI